VLSVPLFGVGISPSPLGTADAALASDNDNPAAPNTGRALLRRFCFEVCFAWGIVNSFHPPSAVLDGRAAFWSDANSFWSGARTLHRRNLSEPIPSKFSGNTGYF